jgi:hypothetical protein
VSEYRAAGKGGSLGSVVDLFVPDMRQRELMRRRVGTVVIALGCNLYIGDATGQGPQPCQVPSSIACAKASVGERLEKEIAHLADKGFKPTDGDRVSVIDKGDKEEFRLDLESGVDYAFIAACGHDCSQVEMVLLTDKQERLAISTEKLAVVILNGAVPATEAYVVTVSAPGCNHIFCGVGLTVMRK